MFSSNIALTGQISAQSLLPSRIAAVIGDVL